MKQKMRAKVIGAGLAGCEAAHQLARAGIAVDLYERKPNSRHAAFHSDDFAELICSNSLRSDNIGNAVGLLKAEMRLLDSVIMRCADESKIPAGGALAVDRLAFSQAVTQAIRTNPLITVHADEVDELPDPPAIIATGPLTGGKLAKAISSAIGDPLYFYDAAAPIVSLESINMDHAFRASRYDKGDADYINCTMTEEEYNRFYDALVAAETAPLHDFESDMFGGTLDADEIKVFEGCMPIEIMAGRGRQTLLYGPLKPVGLRVPKTMKRPYAVVQLRQDDAAGHLYNIVGFQTHLKFGEQKRVFSMIPALSGAEFMRFGVMHRNTFLPSGVLDFNYQVKNKPMLYFAGQITGVEGYVESASSGIVAGISLARQMLGLPKLSFPASTATGALSVYVGTKNRDFQPMNINFGVMEPLLERVRNKKARGEALAARALSELKRLMDEG